MRLLLLPLLLLSLSANAWKISDVGDFKFEMVADDVYVMHGPLDEPNAKNHGFMNNPAAIVSSNAVILIDPGSTALVGTNVLAELEKVTNKPVVAIFNTHIHGDHWLANHAVVEKYPRVKIYAHHNMKAQALEQGIFWLELMARLTEGQSGGTEIVTPDAGLGNGHKVEIDGQQFRIHTALPAHTDTDIMIEHVQSKTLFMGDNCTSNRVGRFDGSSSILGNINALEYIQALDIEQYVPGHGDSGDNEAVIQPYLNYLRLLHKVTEVGFEEGLQGYEIKDANLPLFENWHNWYGFDTNMGKHIDKMYLEVEQQSW
ncbi:MAG: MBL fold metallo-hydrolase [Gammaproteobacteria bacterium]|nr:MBL fold metallo-hydrolase [Gammaproteobacteria bacterium]